MRMNKKKWAHQGAKNNDNNHFCLQGKNFFKIKKKKKKKIHPDKAFYPHWKSNEGIPKLPYHQGPLDECKQDKISWEITV